MFRTGVEYKAGGVGIGSNSNSVKEKFKQEPLKENLEQLLKQDAIRVIIAMICIRKLNLLVVFK